MIVAYALTRGWPTLSRQRFSGWPILPILSHGTEQTATVGSCPQPQLTFNTNNQITSPGYSYDAAGNMTHDASHSYSYDAEDRITQVDGGTTASYAYDAFGNRVQKVAAGVTTNYFYNLANQIVAEQTTAGWSVGYVYFDGESVAQYANSTTLFTHCDHVDSAHLMTNMSAGVYDNYDYLPFGEQTAGGTGTTHKFEGKERDAETSNDDFGARYYSSSIGRFMSADWSAVPAPVPYANLTNPQTLNLYAMVNDNPVSFADLDGHMAFIGEPCWTESAGCGAQSNQSTASPQNQTLNLSGTVTSGPTSSDGSTIVQPPTFLSVSAKSDSSLAPGTYQVAVSVTKVTTGKDDGQPVKAAELTSKVDPVQGVSSKLGGTQQPEAATKFSLVIGISAKNGDFHYEGDAKVNITLTGPTGSKGSFSVPVELERGNPGAPSVGSVSGGRSTFVVPPN